MKALSILFATVLLTVLSGKAVAQSDKSQTKGETSSAVSSVKNVEAEQAAKLLQENKKIVVLDVRTSEEFAAGHIAGATNLDFHNPDFEKKLSALDKTKSYLVHCAAGGRSAKTRDLMKKQQFQSIYHLEGGLKAWEKAGKPVER
jgi:rhodanese-related sulfurtransferase